MKLRRTIILTAASVLVSAMLISAQSRVSPRSQRMLRTEVVMEAEPKVGCFIRFADPQVLDELRGMGVEVNYTFGDIATAQVPKQRLREVSQMARVRSLQTATPMSLCNDAARSASRVNQIHGSEHVPMPYTGKGIVVGMVDVGIDFNNVEFRDENGDNRIKSVYLPSVDGGEKPVIGENELPGSIYESPELIANLTTDCDDMSHGTHTTTTAAGSYRGNGFYGVATDAEIVACAMPEEELTDVNIANSVAYIFDYADRVGKPAVVNMSLSANMGPHDGTSMLSQAIANVTGEGKICVLSIGNDGYLRLKLKKRIEAETDTMRTFLENLYKAYVANGEVDVWASNNQPFKAQFVVYNRSKNAIDYQTEWYVATDEDDEPITIKAEEDDYLGKNYSGEITFASGVGDNGKMEIYTYFDLQYTCTKEEARNYYFGLRYTAAVGTELTAWSSTSTQLVGNGKSGWLEGTPEGAINDMATGEGVISVGGYATKTTVPHIEGEANYTSSSVGDIMRASGYGADENGVMQPMITAPGYMLVSAMNRYDKSIADMRSEMAAIETIDGIEYMWREMGGTSMSSPIVAGIVASWLQADNHLDADQVKEILEATSVRDEFITESNANRWGYGKIDALAGLQYILKSGLDEAAISPMWTLTAHGQVLTITTPSDGVAQAVIYNVAGQEQARLSGEARGGLCQMTLQSGLQRGIYLVKVQVAGKSATLKAVIGN